MAEPLPAPRPDPQPQPQPQDALAAAGPARWPGAMLPGGSEWTFEQLERYDHDIARVARHCGLDTYPNQIEIIRAEQMMDAYASNGLPLGYSHWSFGKRFLATEQHYKRGQMGLAYEIVINSNPCIAYLMEENTLAMQALVIAHASYGHNSFFKGNYLFRTWTQPDAIIDYLVFARRYVADCEQRHGVLEVEQVLDACHALANLGVDRYKRPQKRSLAQEQALQKQREAQQQEQVNQIWRTLPQRKQDGEPVPERPFPPEPQENVLYFVEKHAPMLESWQREIVRIVRKLAQYFYPQRQTQVMNEGWATFWHYTLTQTLYDEGVLPGSIMLEILHSHTNVIAQPAFDAPNFNGINPYALGFAMYRNIRRICESPTAEDRRWFPDIAGSDWRATLTFAMRNFKDESFIAQFLSPALIRSFRLFCITDDDRAAKLKVGAIHDDQGYRRVRDVLARQYALAEREPDLQVASVDVSGDRSLTLRHFRQARRPLAPNYKEVMHYLAALWGFTVKLEVINEAGTVESTDECRVEKRAGLRQSDTAAWSLTGAFMQRD